MYLLKLWRSFVVIFLFGFFGTGAIIINYLVFPWISVFVKKERRKQNYCKVVHNTWNFFCKLMQKAGAIKIVLENPEEFSKIKGKIIVANHPSFIDIVLIIGLLPDTVCIAKKELKKNIVMGNIVKSVHLINDEDNDELLKESSEILKSGYNIVIFPTGTRTTEGENPKLHKGAALMALHTGVNIVPLHIGCDYKFLAKHQKIYDAGEKPVTYTITVNEEINVKDYTEQDLTKIQMRNRINSAIKERIQK